jgi:hypothetical protein
LVSPCPGRASFQSWRRDKPAATYVALADFALRERTRTGLIQSDPVPASMEHMMPAAPTQPELFDMHAHPSLRLDGREGSR